MTDEKPPSREALAEDVAARMRAAGLDATSDGDSVTVRERENPAAAGGASTGRNIATVLGVTFGAAVIALLLALLWFGLAFLLLGGEASEAGRRAGVIGFTLAALLGGLGALFAGAGAKTPAGKRDVAALIVGILLAAPLLLIALGSLGNTMDALTQGIGKLGILAGVLFFGVFAFLGDRFFKQR